VKKIWRVERPSQIEMRHTGRTKENIGDSNYYFSFAYISGEVESLTCETIV